MLCAQRYGQLFGRASNYASCDCFSICASLPNRPQITQIFADESKTEPTTAWIFRDVCRAGAAPARLGNGSGRPTVNRDAALRASHVDAGAGIDLDRFAFLDEKRHVNGLAGFELCRLGNVTGSIAANAFG